MREALARLSTVVGECVDASVDPLSDTDLVGCLEQVHRLVQGLTAVQLHLIREVDGRGLPAVRHATSTPAWLREHLRVGIGSAKRLAELAAAVDRRPGLDAALACGVVNVEQAQVIASTLADLQPEAGSEVADKAEALLIDHAGMFEPRVLRRFGERILWHVAPDLAEAADAEALARQEAHAYRTRAFTLSRNGDGRVRLSGWLDEAGAAVVNAALDPLCAPRHDTSGEPGRTAAQRRADALVEVCELALRTETLPESGGDRPQVVVTVPFDVARHQLGAGMLDIGARISPEQVRRMACDAKLIPAVLGGDGQVLDLGRTRRLITGPLRRALELRDGGCAWPGCDRPARWAQGHHIIPWSQGGSTSLDNSVLLCGRHHRIIHKGEWTVRISHDGRPESSHPRTWTRTSDGAANTYHRRE